MSHLTTHAVLPFGPDIKLAHHYAGEAATNHGLVKLRRPQEHPRRLLRRCVTRPVLYTCMLYALMRRQCVLDSGNSIVLAHAALLSAILNIPHDP
jgi:hypothetical protein